MQRNLFLAVFLLVAIAGFATAEDAKQKPKTFPGNRPAVIKPAEDGTLALRASACEVYGKTLQFMPADDALGWWNSTDDHAAWKIAGAKAGTYEVWFEWSCADESAGHTYVVQVGGNRLTGTIPSTSSRSPMRRPRTAWSAWPRTSRRPRYFVRGISDDWRPIR